MILTINTCMAPVYVFLFIPCYLPPTTLYRYLAGIVDSWDYRHSGSCPQSVVKRPKIPKFKQLEHFLTNVKISIPTSNGRGTKTIHGLIERVRRFTFSKNDGQESTVAVRFFIISIRSFYPVTNYCKAPLIISTSGIPKSLV